MTLGGAEPGGKAGSGGEAGILQDALGDALAKDIQEGCEDVDERDW